MNTTTNKKRHTTPRTARPSDLPSQDAAALAAQLQLSRAQCAYLHRQLTATLVGGPLEPHTWEGEASALEAANADMRQRLHLLELNREELEGRLAMWQAEYDRLDRENARLREDLFGRRTPDAPEPPRAAPEFSFDAVPGQVRRLLTRLVMLAHPDKWQGRPAPELAHELMLLINDVRRAQK